MKMSSFIKFNGKRWFKLQFLANSEIYLFRGNAWRLHVYTRNLLYQQFLISCDGDCMDMAL